VTYGVVLDENEVYLIRLCCRAIFRYADLAPRAYVVIARRLVSKIERALEAFSDDSSTSSQVWPS